MNVEFSMRLQHLIEEADITQKELSIELHLAPTTLNGYVNSYREPDFSTLVRLARYFDVTTDYLLGISDLRQNISADLNPEENNLLHIYRNLVPERQELMMEQAKTLYRFEKKHV